MLSEDYSGLILGDFLKISDLEPVNFSIDTTTVHVVFYCTTVKENTGKKELKVHLHAVEY